MGEAAGRRVLYSAETERATSPLDVHGIELHVGDNVRSTADFHETERWVGVVVALGKRGAVKTRRYGLNPAPNGIEVCARLYVQGVAGRGEVATLYSAACLWERISSVDDVPADEQFT